NEGRRHQSDDVHDRHGGPARLDDERDRGVRARRPAGTRGRLLAGAARRAALAGRGATPALTMPSENLKEQLRSLRIERAAAEPTAASPRRRRRSGWIVGVIVVFALLAYGVYRWSIGAPM